jgi:hypothetical protein
LSQRFDQRAYLISSVRSGCRLLQRDHVLAQRADNAPGRAAALALLLEGRAGSAAGQTRLRPA